jgi:hypothetical protein
VQFVSNAPVSPSGFSEISAGTSASVTGLGFPPTANGNAQWQNRRNRGPPLANQPLKTFGHNSKPSVSQNPAAFAAAMAAQKPKRKVCVRLPVEGDGQSVFPLVIAEEDEETAGGEDSKESGAKSIRQRWTWRTPLQEAFESVLATKGVDDVQAQSTAVMGESERQDGLPDFVDIYLPGQSAWDEVRELIELERQERNAVTLSANDWGIGAGGGDGSTFGLAPARSEGRKLLETPPRNATHSTTMSLSISPSGVPFGPSTLSALGLPSPSDNCEKRAQSDTEQDAAERLTGSRPPLNHHNSDPVMMSPSRLSKKLEDKSWKALGLGFGYDLAEEDEEEGPSKYGGEEDKEDSDAVRSDNSRDADASESDGEDSAEWLKRRRYVSNKPVEALVEPDDSVASSDLEDMLSEEFSNPSDEETARRLRREMIAERESLHRQGARLHFEDHAGYVGNRPRADTGDTYASSGLGDAWSGDIRQAQSATGRSIDIMPRGPLDSAPDTLTGGMSRSSTKSTFRADAPEFNPRGNDHYRLPSIARSSFGQSFGHGKKGSGAAGLNAAAPSFVPGAFTFTAPSNAPKLPSLQQQPLGVQRDGQGREKRFRHLAAGQIDDAGYDMIMANSPPRPRMSAASLESGLRDAGRGVSYGAPHPFNLGRSEGTQDESHSQEAPPQPILGSFSFQPNASAFLPGITDEQHGQVPQSDFTFSLPRRSSAVTIRRPEDVLPAALTRTSPSHNRSNLSMLTDNSFDAAKTFGGAASGRTRSDTIASSHHLLAAAQHSGTLHHTEDSEDENSTMSDIIEELGERMDRSLEGWAGKILDEVTIMGQVRPLNVVTLEAAERQLLVESLGREVGDLLADYNDRLHERLMASPIPTPRHLLQTSESDTSTIRPESRSVTSERGLVLRTSTASLRSRVLEDREEETQNRILALQQSLGDNREELQRDVRAAIADAVPQAIGDAVAHMKSLIDAERLEAGLIKEVAIDDGQGEGRVDAAQAGRTHMPVELSAESSTLVASLLIGRMQPVLDELSDKLNSHHQQSIARAVEPILEEYFTQSKTRSQAEKHDLLQDMQEMVDRRQKEMQAGLDDVRDVVVETLQTSFIQKLVPHLDTLKPDHDLHADLICGRITEILVPLIKGEDRQEPRNGKADTPTHSAIDAAELSTLVVQQLRPVLQHRAEREAPLGNHSLFDAGEMDYDAMAERVVQLLRADRNAGESRDFDTIVAFLEPLVQKQDEVRSLSRKALEKQHEVEMTLNALPSAVNTKMEVLLSSNQTLRDGQAEIVEKLQELFAAKPTDSGAMAMLNIQGREELRDDVQRRLLQAETALADERQKSSKMIAETVRLQETLNRVQEKLNEAEEDRSDLARAKEEAEKQCVEIRRDVEGMLAERARFEAQAQGMEDMITTLRVHTDRMEHELHKNREERAHERDSAARTAADTVMRCERAEEQLRTERSRVEVLLDQMRSSEQDVQSSLQRAAKAEGELAAYEKRIGEQDVKISNLQQLTATQKQKAAQSGQKLSEVEKRLRELEASDRELHVAQARLKDMETRTSYAEEMERDLRIRIETERRLRQEVATMQSKFLDMERDLMSMRETLVGRDELEQSQADLNSAREEVAELRGQIAERDRREQDVEQKHAQALIAAAAAAAASPIKTVNKDALKPSNSNSNADQWPIRSPSHGSTTWASIYAPNDASYDEDVENGGGALLAQARSKHRRAFADDSFASPRPNGSLISNNSRHVECSVDGWWS